MNLKDLNQQIKACTKCNLREECTAPVCGLGNVGAKYFVIGEAPGKTEDEKGVPFIGAAGKKLDKLIALGNISLNDIYLTNTVKCRPPNNDKPKKRQTKLCCEWLWQELELVNPQYIITLGAVPLSLFTEVGIGKMHGTLLDIKGRKLIAQYHPAASLHQPRLWAAMLDDWENLPKQVPHSYTLKPESRIPPEVLSLDTESAGEGGFTVGDWSIAYRDKEGKLSVERYRGARTDKLWGHSEVVMHNAKWDLRVLRSNGMQEPKNVQDTMIAAYCLGLGYQAPSDDTKSQSGDQLIGGLGLKYLSRKHLGMQMKEWSQVANHPEEIPEYNDNDSIATYLLWEQWKPILPKHYFNIDMPLLGVLMAMEDRGIAIDQKYLETYAKELQDKISAIELPLNPNSILELQSYVYGTLEVEPHRFTEGGMPSVDEEILRELDDPICNKVLEWKSLSKELSTYADNYIQGSMLDGRIHPEFKQVRTSTGRLSCANPNLQNVPDANHSTMRKLFIAKPHTKLVVVDYQQIELRMLAAMSQDPVMLKAFLEGRDIHNETLLRMLPYMPTMVRRDAKVINFLSAFGGSAWKISLEFGIPIDAAKEFQEGYFKEFPGIKDYMDQQRQIARSERKVSMWTGRTRRLNDMYAPDWRIQQGAEREAINTPIQGGAGEVVKLAMIDLHYKHHIPMLGQIHDEIISEIPDDEAEECADWLHEYLPNLTIVHGVNFPVDVGVGDNWLDAKKNADERKKKYEQTKKS